MAELLLFSQTNNNNNILTNDKPCVTVYLKRIDASLMALERKANWSSKVQ
jgi:hypothetical protein